MNDTSIYVVTHKKVELPNKEGYIPIIVGNHDVKIEKAVYDNIGDNIAEKNPNFCELTALYWIWKNDLESKFVGISHYRRFLLKNARKFTPDNLLDVKTCEKWLNKYDIILPFPRVWFDCTVQDWFLKTDGKEKDLVMLRKIINEKHPDSLQYYDDVMNGYEASYCNMFVMPKKLFDEYCQWLFDILFELEKRTDISSYTALEARIYGFLSERLLNVWVRQKKLKVKYVHMYEENKHRSRKNRLKEKLMHIIVNKSIFSPLRKCKWGYMDK